MRYETVDGFTHIYVDEDETEEQVLVAIARASFDLARPAGRSWSYFDLAEHLLHDGAQMFVYLPPRYGKVALSMDYVNGRQCKTVFFKEGTGHFSLNNRNFEPFRGSPDAMLELAKGFLAGAELLAPIPAHYLYKGENLTKRLAAYGFKRNTGENDWEFRKRVFPVFFFIDSGRAIEYLMGSSVADLDDEDTPQFMAFRMLALNHPTHEQLAEFANGFLSDPLVAREKRKRAKEN